MFLLVCVARMYNCVCVPACVCVFSASLGDGFQLHYTVQSVDGVMFCACYWDKYDINRLDNCIGVI